MPPVVNPCIFVRVISILSHIFTSADQDRFLAAINRWADRYPGWATVVGGGVVVVVDR